MPCQMKSNKSHRSTYRNDEVFSKQIYPPVCFFISIAPGIRMCACISVGLKINRCACTYAGKNLVVVKYLSLCVLRAFMVSVLGGNTGRPLVETEEEDVRTFLAECLSGQSAIGMMYKYLVYLSTRDACLW